MIPETAKRVDWPRLVKQAVEALGRRIGALEAGTGVTLANHADDAAAASGGVPVGGLYRTGSAVKVREA